MLLKCQVAPHITLKDGSKATASTNNSEDLHLQKLGWVKAWALVTTYRVGRPESIEG